MSRLRCLATAGVLAVAAAACSSGDPAPAPRPATAAATPMVAVPTIGPPPAVGPSPVVAVTATLWVAAQPCALTGDATGVWVSGYRDGLVQHIDARTLRTTATYHVGGKPCGLAVVGSSLW